MNKPKKRPSAKRKFPDWVANGEFLATTILTNHGVSSPVIKRAILGEDVGSLVPQVKFDDATWKTSGSDKPAFAAAFLFCLAKFKMAFQAEDIDGVAEWANMAGGLYVRIMDFPGFKNHVAGGKIAALARREKREKEIDPLIREAWSKMSPEDRMRKPADALSAALEKMGLRDNERRAPRTCHDDIKRLKLRG
jgi:hypothetical protein